MRYVNQHCDYVVYLFCDATSKFHYQNSSFDKYLTCVLLYTCALSAQWTIYFTNVELFSLYAFCEYYSTFAQEIVEKVTETWKIATQKLTAEF